MAAPAVARPLETGSIEVLKLVKATENEWEAKLAAARRETEETTARLRSEAESAIRAARTAAEDDRARALETARAGIDQEVAAILAQGETAAKAAGRVEGRRPSDQLDRVIAVVLGPFAPA